MADSTQQKLSRVRPPRVQITYDVENGGTVDKKELPFIVGIMADLSGKPAAPLPPVKDRKFVEIDSDNFNEVLSAATPRLALRVPNKLVKDSDEQLAVELTFSHLDDFSPVEVMGQVPALKALLDARKRLRDLLTKLDGNDELDSLLNQVVRNTEDQSTLKKQLGSAG
ncbi:MULTISPECIES: type VI secretion system contractile sheath small subunit [unclassified Azospirillum]|uniref:type VI secretion system contractile sheath small subunit n=1 Tax=unclassified Azospirillum TaxID=2630922 RepID=UPI000B651729|nr:MULTISPECIES: type VI secretion system contractile sheath small subunit [unclassified Azospirillum]SNS12864.1 type VI secretion system protein ImpB [Azospirillum sp. RU38E]SNS29902.1 type VI secretion system protein ImpB [Azospirillum sp. RU37A]